MKKVLLIALLFTWPAKIFSQNLTVGQVYNYSVGDIFERKETGFNGYFYAVKDTIIGKWFSAGMDTVFYERTGTGYSPPTGPGQSPNYFYFRDTVSYTSLNSIVSHPMQAFCFSSIRDSFYNQCTLPVWERYSVTDTGCFEPRSYRSWYIEGAGGPYFEDNYPAQWSHTIFQLMYYKKGNDSCGVSIVTTVSKEIASQLTLIFFPGQIKCSDTFNTAIVYDMTGRVLLVKEKDNAIDLPMLTSGIYFLKVELGNNVVRVERFFQQ